MKVAEMEVCMIIRKKNNEVKQTNKLPMGKKLKKGFFFYCLVVVMLVMGAGIVLAKETASWVWYRADWLVLKLS